MVEAGEVEENSGEDMSEGGRDVGRWKKEGRRAGGGGGGGGCQEEAFKVLWSGVG